MSMIFGGDDYESAWKAYLDDSPLGISGSMKEDLFNEIWDREHGINQQVSPVPPKPISPATVDCILTPNKELRKKDGK